MLKSLIVATFILLLAHCASNANYKDSYLSFYLHPGSMPPPTMLGVGISYGSSIAVTESVPTWAALGVHYFPVAFSTRSDRSVWTRLEFNLNPRFKKGRNLALHGLFGLSLNFVLGNDSSTPEKRVDQISFAGGSHNGLSLRFNNKKLDLCYNPVLLFNPPEFVHFFTVSFGLKRR